MLFTFREQQYRTRLVAAFHQRFQRDPGFSPTNYPEFAQIPEVLNQVVARDYDYRIKGFSTIQAVLRQNKSEVQLTGF